MLTLQLLPKHFPPSIRTRISLWPRSRKDTNRLGGWRALNNPESAPEQQKNQPLGRSRCVLVTCIYQPLTASTRPQSMGKKETMTMTKIPSRKPSGTYGHGPLNICFWKGKMMTMTKISSKKTCYTNGRGPLINFLQSMSCVLNLMVVFAQSKTERIYSATVSSRPLSCKLPISQRECPKKLCWWR